MKITAARLTAKNACKDQIELFQRTWPHGAYATLTNIKKAQALDLDLDRFACLFFSVGARAKYAKISARALAKYQQTTIAAWKEYQQSIVSAFFQASSDFRIKNKFGEIRGEFMTTSLP